MNCYTGSIIPAFSILGSVKLLSNNQKSGEPVDWVARIAPFKRSSNKRAIFELFVTVVPLVLLWVLMWFAWQNSILLGILASIPVSGFLVRLFAIQHDCGHGSMFTSSKVNDWVGRVIGVFTFTPYFYWKHSHALHHVSSGNLDKRGHGDIETKTVEEYWSLSPRKRFLYRLYRNPIVLFVIGPAYMFFLKQRLPVEMLGRGSKPWVSTMGTNIGIVALFALGIYFLGLWDFVILQLLTVFTAGAIGVWLFYVQHQYEDTFWERNEVWEREHAALLGSSYYEMPKPLMWITANIGIHHVHHLSSKVPFYNLPKILKNHPELKKIGRLTIWNSIKCIPLTLWDEQQKKLLSFREAHRLSLSTAVLNPAE